MNKPMQNTFKPKRLIFSSSLWNHSLYYFQGWRHRHGVAQDLRADRIVQSVGRETPVLLGSVQRNHSWLRHGSGLLPGCRHPPDKDLEGHQKSGRKFDACGCRRFRWFLNAVKMHSRYSFIIKEHFVLYKLLYLKRVLTYRYFALLCYIYLSKLRFFIKSNIVYNVLN